jgi:hypothetical protein
LLAGYFQAGLSARTPGEAFAAWRPAWVTLDEVRWHKGLRFMDLASNRGWLDGAARPAAVLKTSPAWCPPADEVGSPLDALSDPRFLPEAT